MAKNGDRVIGLEVIPYAELQRPRIDVSLRISGLFRDTFPNLIRLIEEAVNMVASLEEEEDINYIKKHKRKYQHLITRRLFYRRSGGIFQA